MMTSVSTENTQEPRIILHTNHLFEYGKCDCCEKPIDKKEYIPIFGVGGIIETSIWAAHARPIKLTDHAINYYNTELDSNKHKQEVKSTPNSIIGQRVGVVRRIVVNGEKIEKYHCPKYELVSIDLPHMYNLCTANVKCYITGVIENVVIERLAIPELIEYT